MNYASYQPTPSKDGKGTFYFTDCGHGMYSLKGPEAYHGCLCPGCAYKHVDTILYIRGSEEANAILDEKIKNGTFPKILKVWKEEDNEDRYWNSRGLYWLL